MQMPALLRRAAVLALALAAVGMRRFGLGYGPRPRRRWYLGE